MGGFYNKYFNYLEYDKHDLIDQLRVLIDHLTDDIAKTNMGIFATQPPTFQQELVQHDTVKRDNETHTIAAALSFGDAFDQLGPHCKEVWKRQDHLNTTAVLFLMSKLTTANPPVSRWTFSLKNHCC